MTDSTKKLIKDTNNVTGLIILLMILLGSLFNSYGANISITVFFRIIWFVYPLVMLNLWWDRRKKGGDEQWDQ